VNDITERVIELTYAVSSLEGAVSSLETMFNFMFIVQALEPAFTLIGGIAQVAIENITGAFTIGGKSLARITEDERMIFGDTEEDTATFEAGTTRFDVTSAEGRAAIEAMDRGEVFYRVTCEGDKTYIHVPRSMNLETEDTSVVVSQRQVSFNASTDGQPTPETFATFRRKPDGCTSVESGAGKPISVGTGKTTGTYKDTATGPVYTLEDVSNEEPGPILEVSTRTPAGKPRETVLSTNGTLNIDAEKMRMPKKVELIPIDMSVLEDDDEEFALELEEDTPPKPHKAKMTAKGDLNIEGKQKTTTRGKKSGVTNTETDDQRGAVNLDSYDKNASTPQTMIGVDIENPEGKKPVVNVTVAGDVNVKTPGATPEAPPQIVASVTATDQSLDVSTPLAELNHETPTTGTAITPAKVEVFTKNPTTGAKETFVSVEKKGEKEVNIDTPAVGVGFNETADGKPIVDLHTSTNPPETFLAVIHDAEGKEIIFETPYVDLVVAKNAAGYDEAVLKDHVMGQFFSLYSRHNALLNDDEVVAAVQSTVRNYNFRIEGAAKLIMDARDEALLQADRIIIVRAGRQWAAFEHDLKGVKICYEDEEAVEHVIAKVEQSADDRTTTFSTPAEETVIENNTTTAKVGDGEFEVKKKNEADPIIRMTSEDGSIVRLNFGNRDVITENNKAYQHIGMDGALETGVIMTDGAKMPLIRISQTEQKKYILASGCG
jgi:hypothetical protein